MTPAQTARSIRKTSRRTYRVRTPPPAAAVPTAVEEVADATTRVLRLDPDVRQSLRQRDIAAFYRGLQSAGVSQRVIANHTGQIQGEVSEIISGRRVQSAVLLERIVDGLGIPRATIGLAAPTIRNPRNGTGPTVDVPLWSGRNVWAFRQSLRQNVVTFAEHLGVSPASVSRWESGGFPNPFQQSLLDTALKRTDPDTQIRFARLASENIFETTHPQPDKADSTNDVQDHTELAPGIAERHPPTT